MIWRNFPLSFDVNFSEYIKFSCTVNYNGKFYMEMFSVEILVNDFCIPAHWTS